MIRFSIHFLKEEAKQLVRVHKEPKTNIRVYTFSVRKSWILNQALLHIQEKQGAESCKSKLLIRLFFFKIHQSLEQTNEGSCGITSFAQWTLHRGT